MKKDSNYNPQKVFSAYQKEDIFYSLTGIQLISLVKITFSSNTLSTPSFLMRMCCCGISR